MAGTEVPRTLTEQLLPSNFTVDLQCLWMGRMSGYPTPGCRWASLWEKTNPVTVRCGRRCCPLLCVYSVRQFRSKGRMSAAPPWIKLIGSVSARGVRVTRSRRSSVWPNPFSTRLPTSRSGTVADRGEESSLHGTEAVCLCSGRVGRSHTVGEGGPATRGNARGRGERGKKKFSWCILVFFFICSAMSK